MDGTSRNTAHTSDSDLAIMSFTAIRNRPPVSANQPVIPGRQQESRKLCGNSRLTAEDHVDVFFLCRAREAVAPEEVEALAPMQIEQLVCRSVTSS